MNKLTVISNPEVKKVFNNYPPAVREHLLILRNLIIETAESIDDIHYLEETLKWGEPSYLTKNGSTLRIDWKAKLPQQYAMYFKCTSLLVSTFKTIFKEEFKFEGNRAIVFQLHENPSVDALKKCIQAALKYHKVKHLPGLGITTESSS